MGYQPYFIYWKVNLPENAVSVVRKVTATTLYGTAVYSAAGRSNAIVGRLFGSEQVRIYHETRVGRFVLVKIGNDFAWLELNPREIAITGWDWTKNIPTPEEAPEEVKPKRRRKAAAAE